MDVFISYSRKDSAIVQEFAKHITAAGFSVWMDIDGIESGDEFKDKIVSAIEESRVFLFFSSEASNVSPWTVKEVNVAVALKKSIIPIRLDESAYNKSILFDLAGLDFVMCKGSSNVYDAVTRLLHALERKIGAANPTADNRGGYVAVNANGLKKQGGAIFKYVALTLAFLLLLVAGVFVFSDSDDSAANNTEQPVVQQVSEPGATTTGSSAKTTETVVSEPEPVTVKTAEPVVVEPEPVVVKSEPLTASVEVHDKGVSQKQALPEAQMVTEPDQTTVASPVKTGEKKTVINGHEYVDLGLPSGLKWATCNVGAASPSEYGYYFAWGEVNTKASYTPQNCSTYDEDMDDIAGNSSYDVACNVWGGGWRMPTNAEFQELIDCCTWVWTKQKGKYGYKITGKNGESIFLPAAGHVAGKSSYNTESSGYYWSSTPDKSNDGNAFLLRFYSGDRCTEFNFRTTGYPVRPVCK